VPRRARIPRAIALLFLLTTARLAPACGGTTGSPAAQMLSDRGARQLAEGRLDEAEASLRLALEVEPGAAPAHANLGLVRLARGDLEGAESSLRGAIHAREDFVEAWSDLGVVLERRGQDEQAEAAYERALSINPLRPEPRLALARLLVRRARPIEARAHLLRLAALLPDDAETLGLLAWTELRLDRPVAAGALIEHALAIDPRAVAARFTHALLRARRGEIGPARDTLVAIEDDPVLGHEASLRIATIDVVIGAHLLAHARLDPMLDEDPFDPAVRLSAAALARSEGNDELAIAHAREARTIDPSIEEAWLIEAECCARLDDLLCARGAIAHVGASSDAIARERARILSMTGL
jgi:Flp pilus assembly protein TadD